MRQVELILRSLPHSQLFGYFYNFLINSYNRPNYNRIRNRPQPFFTTFNMAIQLFLIRVSPNLVPGLTEFAENNLLHLTEIPVEIILFQINHYLLTHVRDYMLPPR